MAYCWDLPIFHLLNEGFRRFSFGLSVSPDACPLSVSITSVRFHFQKQPVWMIDYMVTLPDSDHTRVSHTWQRLTLRPENPLGGGGLSWSHRMLSSNLASSLQMPAAPSLSVVTTGNVLRHYYQMFPQRWGLPLLETHWTEPWISSASAWLAEDPRLMLPRNVGRDECCLPWAWDGAWQRLVPGLFCGARR